MRDKMGRYTSISILEAIIDENEELIRGDGETIRQQYQTIQDLMGKILAAKVALDQIRKNYAEMKSRLVSGYACQGACRRSRGH